MIISLFVDSCIYLIIKARLGRKGNFSKRKKEWKGDLNRPKPPALSSPRRKIVLPEATSTFT